MKTIQFFLRTYFRIFAALNPRRAGDRAFNLFCRTFSERKRFRKKELEFYETASHFKASWDREDIHGYEMGKPEHPMVLLVHGWNSNAGSLFPVAQRFLEQDYYVVAIDLPAHGRSKLEKTHLVMCAEALRTFVHRLLPDRPFSIVSHSFGSAVTAYALSGSRFEIDRWVMLTSPNQMDDVFNEFREFISLDAQAYEQVLARAEQILKEPVSSVSVEERIEKMNVHKVLMLHDRYDRILAFDNSLAIQQRNPKTELVPLEKVGHYRMLSNDDVLAQVEHFINAAETVDDTGEMKPEYA